MALQVRGRLLTTALARAAQLPGGRDALLALLPGDVRARIEPLWIATAWYDAEIFFAVMEASAQLQRMDPVRLVRRASERAAEEDIRGIYRQTLRTTSPRDMADRLPRVFSRYYDAPLEQLELDESWMRAAWSGVPARRIVLFQALNEGFMDAAFRIAGASGVGFSWNVRSTGPDVARCEALVRWRAR
ncbi:MAG TPA: hypothetical protein VIL20_31045 [Sandaracinaceae bacterium]